MKKINTELAKYKIENNLIKVTHTESIVSDDETPLTAIKKFQKYKHVALYSISNKR